MPTDRVAQPWAIRSTLVAVADLDRSVDFYRVPGPFDEIVREDAVAVLGHMSPASIIPPHLGIIRARDLDSDRGRWDGHRSRRLPAGSETTRFVRYLTTARCHSCERTRTPKLAIKPPAACSSGLLDRRIALSGRFSCPFRASRSGPCRFRWAGRCADRCTKSPKPPSHACWRERDRFLRSFPWQAEIVHEATAKPELGVGSGHQPAPAVGLLGRAQ